MKQLVLIIMGLIFIGCGGGSSGGNDSNSSNAPAAVEEVIELIPKSSEVQLGRINAIDINDTNYTLETSQEKACIVTPLRKENIEGSNLFVLGEYKGVVNEQSDDANHTRLCLSMPEDMEDILDSFTIKIDASEASFGNKRRVLRGLGKYDKFNSEGLTYELRQHTAYNKRLRRNVTEPSLRIVFPKGYKIPLQAKAMDLNIDPQLRGIEFDTDFSAEMNRTIPIDESASSAYFTIDTEGSYLEYGLGVALEAEGEIALRRNRRWAHITVTPSALFESNLQVEITGHIDESWSQRIEIGRPIAVSIPVGSSGVLAVLTFTPEIELGASGAINGVMVATSHLRRSGGYVIDYHSERESGDRVQTSSLVNNSFDPINEHGVSLDIDAQGMAYIAPTLAIEPRISLLRVIELSIVTLRGGIDVNAQLEGHFDGSYDIVNTQSEALAQADLSVLLTAEPWVSYEMYVKLEAPKLPKKDGLNPWVLYDGPEKDLYRHDPIEIFDWHIGLLPSPEVVTTDIGGLTYAHFSIAASSEMDPHVRFFYTLDGSQPTESSAMLHEFESFLVEQNETVRVKAVVLASDYQSSFWNFGKSISPTISKQLGATAPVPQAPSNLVASDDLKNAIQINWERVDYAHNYELYTTNTTTGEDIKVATISETNYLASLPGFGNVTFSYKVRACNIENECGDFSNVDEGTAIRDDISDPSTPGTPNGPDVPSLTSLTANAGEDQYVAFTDPSVPVTFSASGSLATGAAIVSYEWRESTSVVVISSNENFTAYFTEGVHTLELTVINSKGDTATDTVVIYVIGAPEIPTNVEAVLKTTGSGQLQLSYTEVTWDAVKDATHYEVYGVEKDYTLLDDNVTQASYHYNAITNINKFAIKACNNLVNLCSDFSEIAIRQ